MPSLDKVSAFWHAFGLPQTGRNDSCNMKNTKQPESLGEKLNPERIPSMRVLRKERDEASQPIPIHVPLELYQRLDEIAETVKLPIDVLAAAALDALVDLVNEDHQITFPLMFSQVEG